MFLIPYAKWILIKSFSICLIKSIKSHDFQDKFKYTYKEEQNFKAYFCIKYLFSNIIMCFNFKYRLRYTKFFELLKPDLKQKFQLLFIVRKNCLILTYYFVYSYVVFFNIYLKFINLFTGTTSCKFYAHILNMIIRIFVNLQQ